MENELIKRIEKGEFERCFLLTNKIVANNDAFISNNLELNISISNEQEMNENWIIEANGVTGYHNLFGISYMPFFTMKILTDHPLLWDYKYNTIEYELKGINSLENNRFKELVTSLSDCYSYHSGEFIKFDHKEFLDEKLNLRNKIIFRTNNKIFELIKPIFQEYQIDVNITKEWIGERKGLAFKPKARILLIRNPFVSSLKTARGQTYILADDFKMKRKNKA